MCVCVCFEGLSSVIELNVCTIRSWVDVKYNDVV
jgi:hypothetical protein